MNSGRVDTVMNCISVQGTCRLLMFMKINTLMWAGHIVRMEYVNMYSRRPKKEEGGLGGQS